MTQVRLLSDLATTVVLAAFFASLLFVAAYTVTAPWWRSPIGRSLVTLDAGISLTLLPPVLHFTFGLTPDSVFFAWFQVVAVALVAVSTLWRTVIVIRVQRDGARVEPLSPTGQEPPAA